MANKTKNSKKEKRKRNKREIYQIDPPIIEENISNLRGGIKDNKERHNFAMRLNELLVEKEKDQDKFAKCLGISTGTLSYYRKGIREPSLTTLVKMANELNVSVDYLIGKSECPTYNIHDINQKIGLSQIAIKQLYKLQHDFAVCEDIDINIEEDLPIHTTFKNVLEILSKIIESPLLLPILNEIEDYQLQHNKIKKMEKQYEDTKKSTIFLAIQDEKKTLGGIKYTLQDLLFDCIDIKKGNDTK